MGFGLIIQYGHILFPAHKSEHALSNVVQCENWVAL
jgi:hypothetical protein